MSMAFCKNCGAELGENDVFCSNCGTHTASGAPTTHRPTGYYQPYDTVHVETIKEPKDKLFCELAYSGLLFWLPLAAKTDHPYARFCAGQGLIAVIFATIACICNSAVQWVLGTLFGWLPFSHVLTSLAFMAFLFFMLFLTYRCVKGALAIHNDEKPEKLFSLGKNGGKA